MQLLYRIGTGLYSVAVRLAAGWNPKARKWVHGRRETWEILEQFKRSAGGKGKTYWFHCASLGEFEQGRPLMEALKNREECRIVVTFFSPSGYEIRKNYALADAVLYLPVDRKKNAKRFFDLVRPDKAFFIKYEFWASYIFEAQRRQIPLYSVSAVFRKNQVFFKWYGGYMRRILRAVRIIFVQDEASKNLLDSIGIKSYLSGDTRYDRVMNNAQKAERFPLIDQFTNGHRVVVCGSIWPQDLEVIANGLNKLGAEWKIIVAPHEISPPHLEEILPFFKGKKLVRHSILHNQTLDAQVLIIDNIGMLMHLYGYADLAYVGGAFKTGLHNILEPASFGLPVIFGPHHKKFPEAATFIDNGIGFAISTASEFETTLAHVMQNSYREKVLKFMKSKQGATKIILSHVDL